MRISPRILGCVAGVGVFSFGCVGVASAKDNQPDSAPRIVGGEATAECSWPTTVALSGCTATLVHPKVVIAAAHCGTGHDKIKIGETRTGEEGFEVEIEFCETFPFGSAQKDDYGMCVLKEEVTGVPITPPLMGDDVDLIEIGTKVWAVGFGEDEEGVDGRKREVELEVYEFLDDFVYAGGGGKDGCIGDSGGPLYVELPDGRGWRAYGITSHGPYPCGDGGGWAQMHLQMEWFEEVSGIDITPCHDANGRYNPTDACGENVPLQPGIAQGSWANGCDYGELAQYEVRIPTESELAEFEESQTEIVDDTSSTITEDTFVEEPIPDDTFVVETPTTEVPVWTIFTTDPEPTTVEPYETCDAANDTGHSQPSTKSGCGCSSISVKGPLRLLPLSLLGLFGLFIRRKKAERGIWLDR